MKEIIGAVILIVGLYGGTKAIKELHDVAKKAALEKVIQGLRPLPRFEQRK